MAWFDGLERGWRVRGEMDGFGLVSTAAPGISLARPGSVQAVPASSISVPDSEQQQ